MEKHMASRFQEELAAADPYLALTGGIIHQALRDFHSADPLLFIDGLDYFIGEGCREWLEGNLTYIQVDAGQLFKAAVTGRRQDLFIYGTEAQDHAKKPAGINYTAAK